MNSDRPRRNAGIAIALAVVFLSPALAKMSALVATGAVRWVEVLTIFAGGFAGGALVTKAVGAWRLGRA